ncbi:putative colanic acid biosynthesis acetyltransferase [Sphingomonas desiccabilis]|uniref:Putative colanic acid biosynthesis acetyltransferase n=1 Tax=Sphingomonas desiccabilis TaxID=429134 RepID=A0A4V1QPR0_9SPHN|nr:putative colanic acid biosynthesis acetyltransferase [Sphingomonas desiccabilis]MBB3912703.1 putative colanic acid biosynthesis acetyltransferase WcaF [Sphingomonas desiccabilis]RXZ34667.1 putative colanic acid biosynthesis acetyltransferase [Sphingomonas desiccabilis]
MPEHDPSSGILPGTKYGTRGRERSFALRHLALRLVWNLVWLLFAAWTPPQLYGWRRFLLRLFGAKMAPGSRVYGSARIWYPPNLEMGRGAVLGWQSYAYTQGPIVIGDYAVVSQWSRLLTGTHDETSETFQLYVKPITIEPHAWVAAGALVGPGVTIGEGAVLGGGGVAFKSLATWTIYAGNPAREIRKRPNFVGGQAASVEQPLS